MKYGHRDVTFCCGRRPQRAMKVLQSFAMTCLVHVQVLLLPADMCWTVMRLLLTNKNDLWRPLAALTPPTCPPMVPMGWHGRYTYAESLSNELKHVLRPGPRC